MRPIIPLLILLLVGWVGFGTWYWTCPVKGHCGSESENAATATPTTDTDTDNASAERRDPRAFRISYQDQDWLSGPDNFRFGKDNPQARIPASVGTLLDSLGSFLANNPERELQITADYAEEELSPDGFLNMGLARSNFVSQYLMGKGARANQIVKLYQEKPAADLFDATDTLTGGVRLILLDKLMAEAEASTEGLEAESEGSDATAADGAGEAEEEAAPVELAIPEGRRLYFESSSYDLPMTDELRDYITLVIQYLNQSPDKKLLMVGHTDSDATNATNMRLGLNRANTIKEYFTQFGLNESQIETSSRGEDDPIATNNTEAGKAQNRRVEISIQ
ncbi:MAG: OmpA family protein [Bacteroidota bacterium]